MANKPEWCNESELTCGFDIDGTLLMWIDELTPGPGKIEMDYAGKKIYLTPHIEMIDLLKQHYIRGYSIYAWSMNGAQHAKAAITKLGLKKYVYHTMCKFNKHMDDKSEPQDIIGTRVYLDYKSFQKEE